MAANRRTRFYACAKCGITSNQDTSLTFHRFPLSSKCSSLKATVWAKFCFPDKEWTTDDSLKLLYSQQKMLCSKHFDDSSFTSSDRKRLNKFAMPSETRNADLVHQPSTSSNISYVSEHAQDIKEISKPKRLLSELNIKQIAEITPRKRKLYDRYRRNILEIIRFRIFFYKIKS